MLVWCIYDIRQNRTRTKVAKLCENQGLYRVQKSVFLGEIEPNRLDELRVASEALIDPATDSVYIFPLSRDDFRRVIVLGQGFDAALVTDEIKVLFF